LKLSRSITLRAGWSQPESKLGLLALLARQPVAKLG